MSGNIPTHLGFVIDGNRRWAKERGLTSLEGHKKGISVVETIAEECPKRGIKYTSFYVFSTENWDRSAEEIAYLMKLITINVKRLVKRCLKNNTKLVILGSHNRLSKEVIAATKTAEQDTKACTGCTICLCFNYGGRQEIIDAANKIKGKVTADNFAAALYHPEIPDVDMIVRTSGEQRLSGFMLWRSAYSEFLSLKKHWPDFTPSDLTTVLAEYARRNRRFGK